MRRVVFFGAYDRDYPRNRILRAGLAAAGVEVREARARARPAPLQTVALALAFARVAKGADTVVVPEFRHKDVPLARFLARGRKLVFDPLVSRYDTLVGDWAIHRPGSLQARWNERIDRRALSLADVVVCDTWAHGELYQSLGAARARLKRVLVGAEEAFFQVPAPPAGGPVRLLYAGGFLPLHGVPILIEAIGLLERRAVPDFEVVMIGRGIEHDRARQVAAELRLERVRFAGKQPYAELPRFLADAHLVLGAFGASDKAGRVVPHKVYQGLAAGRAVVTGDGAGVREVVTPGVHACVVPRANAEALAAALEGLIGDASARERLGAAGRARAVEVATVERVGASMAEAIGAP